MIIRWGWLTKTEYIIDSDGGICPYDGLQQTLMGPDSCLCALAAARLKEKHRPLCSDCGTEKHLQPDSKYSHHICRDSWRWRGFCLSFFPPPTCQLMIFTLNVCLDFTLLPKTEETNSQYTDTVNAQSKVLKRKKYMKDSLFKSNRLIF